MDNNAFHTETSLSVERRIQDIKSQLKDGAKSFYLTEEVSERTKIGSKVWREIKSEVCDGDSYKKMGWFNTLADH